MESITSIFKLLRKDPATAIRYILVVAGIFVTFNNFFDCIVMKSPISDYFLYVGIMGIITLLLIFIDHNSIICFVLALTAILMIIDSADPGKINGGIVFFIFSKRIADNIVFSFILYAITAIVIIASHTFKNKTPADSVNVIIGYFSLYLIDYILSGVVKTNEDR